MPPTGIAPADSPDSNFPQVRPRISGDEVGGRHAEGRDDAFLHRIELGLERLYPAGAGPQVVSSE